MDSLGIGKEYRKTKEKELMEENERIHEDVREQHRKLKGQKAAEKLQQEARGTSTDVNRGEQHGMQHDD